MSTSFVYNIVYECLCAMINVGDRNKNSDGNYTKWHSETIHLLKIKSNAKPESTGLASRKS